MNKLLVFLIILVSFKLSAQDEFLGNTLNHGVVFIIDNDILKPRNQTDQYYSFGQFLGYYQSVGQGNKFFNKIIKPFGIEGKFIFNSQIGLSGYTPLEGNTGVIDRPFVGLLTLKNSAIIASEKEYLKLGVELGIRGAASGAENFQNSMHRLIGNEELIGWETQLPQTVLINLYADWSKAIFITEHFDMIPELGIALGNNQTYVRPNIQARVGWFNGLDYTAFHQTNIGESSAGNKVVEAYLLFQLYGQLTIVDATLKQDFRSDNVIQAFDRSNLLAGYSAQIHVSFEKFGFYYSYHKKSPATNIVPIHSYGSIGLIYRW